MNFFVGFLVGFAAGIVVGLNARNAEPLPAVAPPACGEHLDLMDALGCRSTNR